MLEIDRLHHEFRLRSGAFGHRPLVALYDVSFRVPDGSTVGLVGESGSGKSTLGRCVVRLLRPTAGEVRLDGVPVSGLSGSAFRPYRRKLQMVFQDPDESLNPRMSVGETLQEPLRLWRGLRGRELTRQVGTLLEQVQLSPHHVNRLPHQLSGGQQQRVGIARALASEPEVVVLDEPSSALDVSVRAQILNLLLDLQSSRRVAYLLISHDLSTVRYMASQVVILYLGQVMERGPAEIIFGRPRHPYTQGLLAAAPRVKRNQREGFAMLKGEASSAPQPGTGCPLAPRCPQAIERCFVTPQRLVEIEPRHEVACSVETGVWT